MQLAYPSLPIYRVDVDIDRKIFRHRPLLTKAPLIALSPKNPEQVLALYHLVRARSEQGLNRAREFSWILLHGMDEQELADVLNAALVLVNFSVAEGIGRLPLEAMATGCLLLSCRGGPLGPELPLAQEWQPSALAGAAHWLERVMDARPNQIEAWNSLAEEGLRVTSQYSPEHQAVGVLKAWDQILAELSAR